MAALECFGRGQLVYTAPVYVNPLLGRLGLVFSLLLAGCSQPAEPTDVTLLRVPAGGIQPRVVQGDGVLHLLYYAGENTSGNLFYTTSRDNAATFGEPVRVNSQAGSALSGGTIRGGEIALGADGRIHVAWNGSGVAQPKGPLNPEQPADSPYNGTPLLYSHSDGQGGFTEQRNLCNTPSPSTAAVRLPPTAKATSTRHGTLPLRARRPPKPDVSCTWLAQRTTAKLLAKRRRFPTRR